ncbi:hypothetical protein A374_14625 [Fictibacillus macauensis ZFHKF-1]|uniref:Peptidase S9 prolyl oligopeptidase catalytic domain-containing protein n=1 Tax=Fictibacillus macauensis ZFHKF-1 TaxID=1196324 RepID=I8IYM2_9BACL|nr:alpha/beta fold hydrolase [Fictibacillus macauensis]EIT84571.1 hypothetical protein A374_14625 [Fictibacillus macauensis ZFHKF-1]
MIVIEPKEISSIPVLQVVQQSQQEAPLPLIIFIHGFTSAKEHNLHFAFSLAQKGYRVLLPDMLHHGERMESLKENERVYSFWEIVLQGIADVQTLVDHLQSQHLIKEQRIGLAGTSMGAIITFGALAHYDYIKAAVTLMGTPAYEAFTKGQLEKMKQQEGSFPLSPSVIQHVLKSIAPYDVTQQLEQFKEIPLLIWHSKVDPVVPYSQSRSFYKEIEKQYRNKNQLRYMSDETSGHKVSREAYLEAVAWFNQYL